MLQLNVNHECKTVMINALSLINYLLVAHSIFTRKEKKLNNVCAKMSPGVLILIRFHQLWGWNYILNWTFKLAPAVCSLKNSPYFCVRLTQNARGLLKSKASVEEDWGETQRIHVFDASRNADSRIHHFASSAVIITKGILRGGLQSPDGGFQEGPLK